MNNKTIIEFGFRIIWRIMDIEEGVIYFSLPLHTLFDLHNSPDDTQPHAIICNESSVKPPGGLFPKPRLKGDLIGRGLI